MTTVDEMYAVRNHAIEHARANLKPGGIYFNPRRGNCLKVRRLYTATVSEVGGTSRQVEYADCLSWRPDGERGSKPQSIRVDVLLQYWPVWRIAVCTPFGDREMKLLNGR